MASSSTNERQRCDKIRAAWAAIALLYHASRWAFLIGTFTGVMEALLYPLLLLVVWKGFSLFLAGGRSGGAVFHQGMVMVAALFGVLAIQHLLRIVNETAVDLLRAQSSQQINTRLMSKMSEIPYQFFEENTFQARYGRVISQAAYRPGMLVEALISTLGAAVAFLGIAVTLVALAPFLVALLLVMIPLMAVEGRFHSRIVDLQTFAAPDLFRMQYLAQKSIDATWQRDIRVQNSSILHEEHHMLGQRYLGHLKRLLHRFQVIRVGAGMAASAVMTLAAAVAFWLINQGHFALAAASILLPALYLGLTQGKALSFSWGSLLECLGYIEQVFDFLNQSFESPRRSVGVVPVWAASDPCPLRKMSIRLHALSFKYPHTDKVALSDISYTFSPGTTAIVGPNGSGKSTLVKLLTGLLTPTSGYIRAQLPSGVYLTPEQLHRAVLFQEPSHLYLTVRQNITMRFERAPEDDARIYDALDQAGLAKAVKALPDGLDTRVGAGFGGQTDLSGGQWQRLALARLLYQDAPVIILDEPVASLDPEGERAIFEFLSQRAHSKLIIFTTHRYDSIPDNATIVVLVDGVIAESGTHEELLHKRQDYWSLYATASQARFVKSPAIS